MSEPLTQPWLTESLTRVDQLGTLKENWDSYHGLPMATPALTLTKSLLNTISALTRVQPDLAPQLCPEADGGIQIEWHEQGFDLEVTIEPDGRITGWLRDDASKQEVEW